MNILHQLNAAKANLHAVQQKMQQEGVSPETIQDEINTLRSQIATDLCINKSMAQAAGKGEYL